MQTMKYQIKPGSLFRGMFSESERDALTADMRAKSLLRIEGDGRGMSVLCAAGLIWLTQPGDADDHLLRQGQTFGINRKGLIVITAFADTRLVIHPNTSPGKTRTGYESNVSRLCRDC